MSNYWLSIVVYVSIVVEFLHYGGWFVFDLHLVIVSMYGELPF